ncbi:MAG TPA: hypothetical protein VF331_24460 [Polyangiales bacterium]
MKIPGAELAVVEPEKVRDYLVSSTHPVGKFKSVFFASLGYTEANWAELQRDLLVIVRSRAAVEGKFSRFGNKYEVSATLTGASGKSAVVATVWIVKHGETTPRFVTAYPGETL